MNLKTVGLALALLVPGLCYAGHGIHLDASSDAAAARSFQRMVNSLDGKRKDDLLAAVAQLDKAEGGASGAASSKPPVVRIKDKIAGLTAEEIIDLAHRNEAGTATDPGHP
ncbi:MAG TPA: hypothetical protein VHE32_02055 [Rhodanobacteraceae bacterium]|jgi:hypothetical protein|nr:hypothetical protein [Rhodanobacteraceae bacterium]